MFQGVVLRNRFLEIPKLLYVLHVSGSQRNDNQISGCHHEWKDKNSVTSYEMLHLLEKVEQPAKNNVSQKCVKRHQI